MSLQYKHKWLAATFIAVMSCGAGTSWSDERAAELLGDYAAVVNAPVRGVIRATERAVISTSEALVAIRLPFREGENFKRGDLIAEFDCRRQVAAAEAAAANFEEASINVSSAVALDRQKAVGKNDVEIAKVREARAKAEFQGLAPKVDECKFVAPFDGRIDALVIRPYERTEPQRPYLTIIGDSQLEVEAIVPSRLLSQLKNDALIDFRVDELAGVVVKARIKTVGAAVEPVSKTVKIIGLVETRAPGLLSGMSGTVVLEAGTN